MATLLEHSVWVSYWALLLWELCLITSDSCEFLKYSSTARCLVSRRDAPERHQIVPIGVEIHLGTRSIQLAGLTKFFFAIIPNICVKFRFAQYFTGKGIAILSLQSINFIYNVLVLLLEPLSSNA